MSYIKGVYRKHIFKSDKGYIIGLLKLEETDDEVMGNYIGKLITFTGTFHELVEDESYKMEGSTKEHPRYGTQFDVLTYEKLKPSDKDGIIAFLSSDLFPKVGKKLATSIVDTLGLNALDLILDEPASLQLVPKMTTAKADIIYNVLLKYDESHRVIVYLTDLGFSMNEALLIYNYYLKETMNIIDTNIFKLIDDINELSFVKIDNISKKFSIDKFDPRRVKACIIYMFKSITFSTGNTYLNYDEIYNSVCNYIGDLIDTETFDNFLKELINETKVVKEEHRYYLKEMYDATNNIVNKIRILLNNKKNNYKNLDNLIENLEKNVAINYNEKQLDAIKSAINENVLIITGGPGTGKTTIIKAIIELYSQICKVDYAKLAEDNLALLAPTGRASKRLSEATGLPATTIHRFLKWNKETNKFSINEHDKSSVKFVIIDEVSMIDEALFDNLLKGLTDNIRLILVGDYNQLPSVSPGQLLKDLIESETIKTIKLDYLYRQDENSYIISLAQEVKDNELNPCFLEPKSDYLFLKCSNSYIKSNLKKLCAQIIEKGYDYKRFQVMAPMYRGENGIDNLNKALQSILNPPSIDKQELVVGDVIYRVGDKVIELVNMPEENVYNGDVGIISNIINNNGKHEIEVEYDYSIVKYTPKDFPKIKHAFIISIHKSQGSEFDLVMMPITNEYYRMLYRKLIYTGITRAKKKLIIIGSPDAFVNAVNNDKDLTRNTSLKEKLIIMYNYLKK